ncbi:protein LEKR1 [Pelobates fuscus]|uniref:protein LEKR1 n=1 Tax=Pelobates fuscus TaxID=191477 RepID=UPI002FE43BCF
MAALGVGYHGNKLGRLQITTSHLKEKEDELQQLTKKLTCCQQDVKLAQGHRQLLSEKVTKQHEQFMKILSLLKFLQCQQGAIKNDINTMLESWIILKREIDSQLQHTSNAFSAEVFRLNKHLAEAQADNISLQNQMKPLQTASDSFVLASQELQASRQIENELKTKCHDLQKQTVDLQQQLEAVELDFHNVKKETEHYREISTMKTKEANDFQSKLRRMEYDRESTELRLTRELRDKEDSLALFKQKTKALQEEIAERERNDEQNKKRSQRLETELETMKEILKQTQQEVITLQNDRELKIASYQNTIEQLQESIRQKMLIDDNWQAKRENELENERQKYVLKLEEVEHNLREEANLELDIERQKHDELIRKFQKRQDELEGKIPSLISKACDELNKDIELLEKKLKETQTRLTDKDHTKENEISNLKNIIADLEHRLKREQNNNNTILKEMRKDCFTKSEVLKEVTQQAEELKRHLDSAMQENLFLKETVRLECEERFELTEALTQAREQLLELKQANGSFLSSSSSSSQRSFTTERPKLTQRTSNMDHKHLQSLSSNKGRLVSLPGTFASGNSLVSNKHRQSSSSSLPSLPSPYPAKERAFSLTDAKPKLTAVLRSQSTQQ